MTVFSFHGGALTCWVPFPDPSHSVCAAAALSHWGAGALLPGKSEEVPGGVRGTGLQGA